MTEILSEQMTPEAMTPMQRLLAANTDTVTPDLFIDAMSGIDIDSPTAMQDAETLIMLADVAARHNRDAGEWANLPNRTRSFAAALAGNIL